MSKTTHAASTFPAEVLDALLDLGFDNNTIIAHLEAALTPAEDADLGGEG